MVAVAVLKAMNSAWTPREIREHLVASVDRVPRWLPCVAEGRLALGRAGDHFAGAGDHLVLQTAVVEAAVAVGHRLDRAAGDRAPQPEHGACRRALLALWCRHGVAARDAAVPALPLEDRLLRGAHRRLLAAGSLASSA